MRKTPNPGSAQAREEGCTCPIIDNHHGHGFPGIDADGNWTAFFVFKPGLPDAWNRQLEGGRQCAVASPSRRSA